MTEPQPLIVRLTIIEAAKVARRHPDTIRKACESGDLNGFQRKFKGRWTVRADDLDAWIEGRAQPSSNPK